MTKPGLRSGEKFMMATSLDEVGLAAYVVLVDQLER